MGLKHPQSNIYTYLPRIGQRLAAHFLLSLSILSWPIFLGKRFFKLKPRAISLSLIIYTPITFIQLVLQDSMDSKLAKAESLHLDNVETKPTDGWSFYQYSVKIEKYIYLVIYFLSDTISIFELINLLVIGSINTIIVPIRTFAFLLSLLYATYIHLYCREDDFNTRYQILENIVSKPGFHISLKPALITLSVFTLLFLGFYLSHMPIVAAVSLITASAISLYHYKEMYQFPYGVYLHLFAYKQLQTFTRLLVAQGRVFRLYGSLPRILYYIDYVFTALALSYMAVYYNSALRMTAINNQLSSAAEATNPPISVIKHSDNFGTGIASHTEGLAL